MDRCSRLATATGITRIVLAPKDRRRSLHALQIRFEVHRFSARQPANVRDEGVRPPGPTNGRR